MKNIARLLTLALAMLLAAMPALAAGQITITQQTETIVENDDDCKVYVYVELKNEGARPEKVKSALLEITDANGETLASTESYKCYPEILNAGETGYMVLSKKVDDVSDKDEIADCALTLVSSGDVKDELIRYDATAVLRPDDDEDSDKLYARVTFRNPEDDTLRDFVLAYAVKDESGKLLYVAGVKSGSFGLTGGSAVELEDRVKQDIVDAAEKDGETLSKIEAIAYRVVED